MQIGLILGLVFGIIIAFFAFLNTEIVSLNYYFGQVDISVALLVLLSATLGAIAVGAVGLIGQIRHGFALWDLGNKVKRMTKQVEELQEQKNALYDDLSFTQAECEEALQEKEAQLEMVHEEALQENESRLEIANEEAKQTDIDTEQNIAEFVDHEEKESNGVS